MKTVQMVQSISRSAPVSIWCHQFQTCSLSEELKRKIPRLSPEPPALELMTPSQNNSPSACSQQKYPCVMIKATDYSDLESKQQRVRCCGSSVWSSGLLTLRSLNPNVAVMRGFEQTIEFTVRKTLITTQASNKLQRRRDPTGLMIILMQSSSVQCPAPCSALFYIYMHFTVLHTAGLLPEKLISSDFQPNYIS